jgi:hypothetical protein
MYLAYRFGHQEDFQRIGNLDGKNSMKLSEEMSPRERSKFRTRAKFGEKAKSSRVTNLEDC